MRFFFVLPEPVPLPHGMQFTGPAGLGTPLGVQPDDPVVGTTFYQSEGTGGRIEAAFTALTKAMEQAPALDAAAEPRGEEWRLNTGIRVPYTVVDAVTTRESPDPIPDEEAHNPARWTPRMDALTRCIAVADWVLTAHRQATEALHAPLSYVRMVSPVIAYQATGVCQRVEMEDGTHLFHRPVEPWGGQSIVLLDHTNLADPFPWGQWNADVAARFDYWAREQARGNPLRMWRERFIGARRALHVTGDLMTSVMLANTSCETLFDSVLSLLMWEESRNPTEMAVYFEEGRILRRLSSQLRPRLRGNWSTDSGPIGAWHARCYRLRHRVVHGGYSPNAAEAHDAIQAAAEVHKFAWDRIAERRNDFPRSALMTVARDGLEARDLWAGQIKLFAEQVAPTEPNWRDSFAAFHEALVAARLASQRS